MGYVPAEMAASDAAFEIEIMGIPRAARLQAQPLFDPGAERMRG